MKFVFWTCCILIFYVYSGYPALISLLSRLKKRSPIPDADAPRVTIIIPAYNEERWIQKKIENTLELDYPREKLQVWVASDGSTDRTVEIARQFEGQGLKVVPFPQRQGKQEMLNRLVPQAAGEIILLTDANALLHRDALRLLVPHFADPRVGCVTGRRLCILQAGVSHSEGEGLYWRYESWIKSSESRLHSCLGAHGQIYAVRQRVFPHVERVGEDFYIPMKVIASTGLRVVFEPAAIAYTPAAANLAIEFERKTRAHVSFLLSVPLLKDLLLPWRSPVWWQYASHHLMRMLVPPAMGGALITSSLLAADRLYWFAAVAQIAFYVSAGLGFILARFSLRPKIFYAPFYFVFANLAVALAWLRWPIRRYDYAWERTERIPISG